MVEKPGKSKFQPTVGSRRKPTATDATAALSVIQDVVEKGPLPAATPEESTLEFSESYFMQNFSPTTTKKPTALEAVAARRERQRSIPATNENEPSYQQTAASLALNITPSERGRVTMSHFLRDTGMGIPMSQPSNILSNSARSTPRTPATTRGTRAATTTSVSMAIVPQVRVVNGEIVVDESAAALAPTPSLSKFTMEVVNETGRHLTSHAFVKTIGNNRWNKEDTELFYEALSMCGTDFAMISLLFPRRSREQVKGKFLTEERKNPAKVALYLKNKKPLDKKWLDRVRRERQESEDGIASPEDEKKPGRPRKEGIDELLSSPGRTLNRSPLKKSEGIFAAPKSTADTLFTSSPKSSPRRSARLGTRPPDK